MHADCVPLIGLNNRSGILPVDGVHSAWETIRCAIHCLDGPVVVSCSLHQVSTRKVISLGDGD